MITQFANNRRAKLSSLQEEGRGGQSGLFAKKVLSHRTVLVAKGWPKRKVRVIWQKKSKVYPLCKRPAEDQFSNQLHGICIQPVGDPPHSHRLIFRVELAHQGEGQFQSSGLRSNPTLFIDRNLQSPAHNRGYLLRAVQRLTLR